MQATTQQYPNFLKTTPQTQRPSLFQDKSSNMAGQTLECINTHPNFVQNYANHTFQEQEQQQNTVQIHSQVLLPTLITLPHSLDANINGSEFIELRSPDIRQNLSQYETQLKISQQNKQNQPVCIPTQENEQNKPSYYVGDDDSNSNQQDEISPSKNSDDVIAEIQEQQSDQDLQLESDEVDSEDQEFSDDEYPENYDSDSDSETDFESLFRNTSRSVKHKNQAQFLKRYQQVKNELQLEDLMLKQQQMIFGGIPMPRQMQLRKIKVSQFLLSLINNNYVKRLKIGQDKRKKQKQLQSQQVSKTCEAECTLNCAQLPKREPTEVKSVKKVIFSENIQAKVYRNDEEVDIINQTEEISETLNSYQKTLKRYITILPPKNIVPPKQPSQLQLGCNDLIRKFQQTIQKIAPQDPKVTNEQKVRFQISQDLKSNDTNSSEEAFDQQIEFACTQQQPKPKNVLLNDKQQVFKQKTSQNMQIQSVYFLSGEAQGLIAK